MNRFWTLLLLLPALILTNCRPSPDIRLPREAEVQEIVYSPHGDALAIRYLSHESIVLELRSSPNAKANWTADGLGGLSGNLVSFPTDGSIVAVAEKSDIRLFNASDGIEVNPIQLGETLYVLQLKFLENDSLALLVGRRGQNSTANLFLEIWDVDENQLSKPLLLTSGAHNAQWWRPFSLDGRSFGYRSTPDEVGIINTLTLAEGSNDVTGLIKPEQSNSGYVSTLAMAPDGSELALGLTYITEDMDEQSRDSHPLILRINTDTGETISSFLHPTDMKTNEVPAYLVYDPKQQHLAAGLLDASALFLYDLETPNTPPRVLCQGANCCWRNPVFSPDGLKVWGLCRSTIHQFEIQHMP